MSRNRNWVFTINNPRKQLTFTEDDGVKYCSWQLEKGASGTPHYQGYVEFNNPTKFSRVRDVLKVDAHVEPRRGDRDRARAYTRKPDGRVEGPWEFGEWKSQGHRTDLENIATRIREDGLERAIEECPASFIRYHRGMERLASYYKAKEPSDRGPITVIVFVGPPGCGKTRACYDIYPDLWKLDKDAKTVWWDGYAGEATILIDDFYGWIKYSFLLQLLDRYKLRLQVKGGHTYANWKNVLITSNELPENWYHQGLTGALKRRISETLSFQGEFRILAQKWRGNTNPPLQKDVAAQ